jgi:UDP-2,3-diacylglucosamine pyrophosphatase LpxH
MKTLRQSGWLVLIASSVAIFLVHSCKKKETTPEPVYLTVKMNRSALQNNVYYPLENGVRSIELEFSQAIDTATVSRNISFSDKTGSLNAFVSAIVFDRKVILRLNTGFYLKPGWNYFVNLSSGLRSVTGLTFQGPVVIDIRTSTSGLAAGYGFPQRDVVVCISDIHMGEYRGVEGHYCWFGQNAEALADLLDTIQHSDNVRQLVILGDLFDEWVVPYRMQPFDTAAGIHSSADYFRSVAASPVNFPVIGKLREIAAGGTIQVIYVPGNHDMLLTQEILQEIIPGILWMGNISGLGNYIPVNEIVMEHGHRFDFFNCPQPFVNPGHILPPGYFISRIQAEGLRVQGAAGKALNTATGGTEFLLAWTTAIVFLEVNYNLTIYPDSLNIPMDGIDGYSGYFSFTGARNMYAATIEEQWPATQQQNGMPVIIPVSVALLDGFVDLYPATAVEYFSDDAPKKYKIAVLGHTHKPELKVYPPGQNYQAIYANTGSWVNASLTSKAVRTFLMIRPAAWSGSDLDVVSLYQYNLAGNSGNNSYIPVLIGEESIRVN